MEDKKDFLFRFIPLDKRKLLKLDEEAYYSVTDQYTADKISKDIKKQFPYLRKITDATACIGGNTYSFSKYFEKVQAIELDQMKYRFLCENMKTLGVANVTAYEGDLMLYVPALEQEMVFIDPPWGGPNYKDRKKIDLYLSDLELSDVCYYLRKYTDYISLKVPTNFNVEQFEERTCSYLKPVYKNSELRKMNLLVYRTMRG